MYSFLQFKEFFKSHDNIWVWFPIVHDNIKFITFETNTFTSFVLDFRLHHLILFSKVYFRHYFILKFNADSNPLDQFLLCDCWYSFWIWFSVQAFFSLFHELDCFWVCSDHLISIVQFLRRNLHDCNDFSIHLWK